MQKVKIGDIVRIDNRLYCFGLYSVLDYNDWLRGEEVKRIHFYSVRGGNGGLFPPEKISCRFRVIELLAFLLNNVLLPSRLQIGSDAFIYHVIHYLAWGIECTKSFALVG